MPNLLRPMLPSVGGFAISADGYFLQRVTDLNLTSFCILGRDTLQKRGLLLRKRIFF